MTNGHYIYPDYFLTEIKPPQVWALLQVTHSSKHPHCVIVNHSRVMMFGLGLEKTLLGASLRHEMPGLAWEMKCPKFWRGSPEVLIASIHIHTVLMHHCCVTSPALRCHHSTGSNILLPCVLPDMIHPQRSLLVIAEAELSSKHVESVLVLHHAVTLQTSGSWAFTHYPLPTVALYKFRFYQMISE